MRIETDAVIPFPRAEVYRAYRDEIQDFVEYFPNIRQIDVEARKEEGPRVDLTNVWIGGGDIPEPIVKVIGESALSWHDYAVWRQDDWTCDWRIETHSFTEAVRCEGKNRFVDIGARTRLEICGEIGIDLKRVKGVPGLVAGSLGRTVEKFLVRQITANLNTVSEALTQYLHSRVEE